MPAMTKRVNIRTTVPVRNINPPISGSYRNVIMSTGDILKCLCRRAQVEEILPDGKTVKLTMKNYYLDNGAGLDAYHPVKPESKKVKPSNKLDKNMEDVKVNATLIDSSVFNTEAPTEPVAEEEHEESVVETTLEETSSETHVDTVEVIEASEPIAEPTNENTVNAEQATIEEQPIIEATTSSKKRKKNNTKTTTEVEGG